MAWSSIDSALSNLDTAVTPLQEVYRKVHFERVCMRLPMMTKAELIRELKARGCRFSHEQAHVLHREYELWANLPVKTAYHMASGKTTPSKLVAGTTVITACEPITAERIPHAEFVKLLVQVCSGDLALDYPPVNVATRPRSIKITKELHSEMVLFMYGAKIKTLKVLSFSIIQYYFEVNHEQVEVNKRTNITGGGDRR